jgi:hypothetical protein
LKATAIRDSVSLTYLGRSPVGDDASVTKLFVDQAGDGVPVVITGPAGAQILLAVLGASCFHVCASDLGAGLSPIGSVPTVCASEAIGSVPEFLVP